MRASNIEMPDPEYWTTEAYVTAINHYTLPEDYDLFLIEDRIMTGDLL